MNYPNVDPETIAHAINSEIAGALSLEPQNIPGDLVCPPDWFALNIDGQVYPAVETPADLRALAVEWLEACIDADNLTTINNQYAGRALDVLDPAEEAQP